MQVLTRPWGAMHYRCDGAAPDAATGPTLVFANSLGTDLRLWDAVMPLLPAGFRTIRYDKAGHGLSDDGGSGSIAALAEDVIALIEAEAQGPVIFIGLSVGGLIAQKVAELRPDLLRALVLSNTAAKLGNAEGWNARISAIETGGLESIAPGVMERWFGPAFRATPALALWQNMMIRMSVPGYIAACQALAGGDQTAATAKITLPTLVIAGSEDGASPPDLVRATADLIAGARFALIPGAGHLPCVETPAAFAEVLNAFLKEHADV
jgi:3-oxoadipate enol-lactonase